MNEKSDNRALLVDLRKENSKLKIEAQLRKSLSLQLEKQRQAIAKAKTAAQQKSDELQLISTQLAKYLSPQLHKRIFDAKQSVQVKSERKKLTIFFSDLVGFTSMSERLESEEVTALLNFYLDEMSKIALEFGGTIDKFVGDAIMVFFGDPETQGAETDAIKCLNMAIKMQNRMATLSKEWSKKYNLHSPLQVRIGLSSGFCTVGNFGSSDRLDYTAIGSPVNLAARVQSAASPSSILISEDTYSLVKEHFGFGTPIELNFKGIGHSVICYQVVDTDGERVLDKEINGENFILKLNEHDFSKSDWTELAEIVKKLDPRNRSA